MTDVLIVTALELRDPVALRILMKTGDSLLHVLRLALVEAARSRKRSRGSRGFVAVLRFAKE